MKWLRRAIPSAANLGPDTDSSFRSRDPPPFSGAGVRSGYLEPPLPGAGSSVWVCRASLTRGRFIIPVLCGRPFPSDCGVEGEAGGIASRTGRRLRSVLPHIPGGVLRGGYGKSVRKSWPREVVGMERGGKGCGMKAQNSAAARLAERGVAGRMPFSRITIGCFETLTRHPAATAFGGTSHPVSLRGIRSGGNPRLCNKTHKPRPHSLPPASCTPPQRHVSRIFRADPGNPAGRVPTYAPTVSSLRDRIRFTFGKVLCRGSQTPPCNSRQ